ncbi:MAG: hypothetical protein AAEJ52_07440, partial [Myxococcota bacterium]
STHSRLTDQHSELFTPGRRPRRLPRPRQDLPPYVDGRGARCVGNPDGWMLASFLERFATS